MRVPRRPTTSTDSSLGDMLMAFVKLAAGIAATATALAERGVIPRGWVLFFWGSPVAMCVFAMVLLYLERRGPRP